MGTDKRGSRGERSGRYGSDGRGRDDDMDWHERRSRDAERDYDRRWADDGHRERFDDCRDSPERGRKRRNSDRSDDEDYTEQDYRMEPDEESKTIMLRGLPLHVTEDEIRASLEQLHGPQPVDVRLMKKRKGISREFAFVEFYHLQDSTRWMETNQDKVVIQGKAVAVHYSNRRPKFENWLCNSCGLFNFRKRQNCFRCGGEKAEGESSSNAESQQLGGYSGDTIIMRNIGPLSTVEAILNMLSPYAKMAASNIRLIKDKHTGENRGFAFVQLGSPLEASQLLAILQGLQPPLKLHGKTIGVDYAKSARKDSVQPESSRANVVSVASTAIAAAQWSSSQLQQGSRGASQHVPLPEVFEQQTQGMNYQVWPQQREAFTPYGGDGILGAAPGMSSLLPSAVAASGVVVAHPAHVYQAAAVGHPTLQAHHIAARVDALARTASACPPSQVAPAQSAPAASFCAAPAADTSAVPDTSTYQYDESSGYYYDPKTGLYYDPSSQYYYNSESQQYLYWDSVKQTYVPAPQSTNEEQSSAAATSSKDPKEKKEKPKSKSAQQIAKDMERWAKSLNRKKEAFASSFQGAERERESAAADAGFSLFEKKQMGAFDTSPLMNENLRIPEEPTPAKASQSSAVAAYSGDSDPEERASDRAPARRQDDEEEDAKITDWKKMVCLLCRRQFPAKDALLRHQQLSDLHKQNLEVLRKSRLTDEELEELERREAELKYRDRAAERRGKYGVPEPPAPPSKKKKFYPPPTPTINYEQPTKDGLTSDNIGNKMLQAMGWQEGRGLGRHQQGITTPIAASLRTKGTGLGIKGSAYELSASDTYKDAVRKAMFARFTDD